MIQIGFSELDAKDEGVSFIDRNMKIMFWNKAAENITGYKRSECCGSRCSETPLCHSDEFGNRLCYMNCPLTKTLKDGLIRETSAYIKNKSGEFVKVDLRVAPVFESTGAVAGAYETFNLRSDSNSL
jgi:PAS domain S-box-containing protein